MLKRIWKVRCIWVIATLIGVGPDSALAEVLPKQITLVIGSSAGGGYDQYARLAAKYLPRHFPGNPPIVVQNMPGAGGMRLLSWMDTAAPQDGSVMGTLQGSAIFEPLLLGGPAPAGDSRAFNYLISLDRQSNFLLVWHTTPYKSVQDAFSRQIVLGTTGGPSGVVPIMYNRLLGTKFKVVTGYGGTNEVLLAMERGELDGSFTVPWAGILAQPRLLNDNLIRILLQLNFNPIEDPRLASVPSFNDFVKDKTVRDMLEIFQAKDDVGRVFIAPKNVPPDLVRIFRESLLKMTNDPEFLAEAKERNMPLMIKTGEEVEAYVKRIYGMPDSTISRLREEVRLATEQAGK